MSRSDVLHFKLESHLPVERRHIIRALTEISSLEQWVPFCRRVEVIKNICRKNLRVLSCVIDFVVIQQAVILLWFATLVAFAALLHVIEFAVHSNNFQTVITCYI